MICQNCKADIADNAKLCPLCHVVPVIKWGRSTEPVKQAAPSKVGALLGWALLLVVVGAAAFAYLNPEMVGAIAGKGGAAAKKAGINGPESVRMAQAVAGAQNAQTNDVASQLQQMGVLSDQTAAAPAAAPQPTGLRALWAKVFNARDKSQAQQNDKVREMAAADAAQLQPGQTAPAPTAQTAAQPAAAPEAAKPAEKVDALDLLGPPGPDEKK